MVQHEGPCMIHDLQCCVCRERPALLPALLGGVGFYPHALNVLSRSEGSGSGVSWSIALSGGWGCYGLGEEWGNLAGERGDAVLGCDGKGGCHVFWGKL